MTARLVCLALVSLLLPTRSGAQCQPEPRLPLATSEVLPGLDLESQVDRADIIVLGTLDELCNRGKASLHENGPAARFVTGSVSVRQVLKGPADIEAIAFASPVLESAISTNGKPHRYGIFFFTYRGAHITFTSPYEPMLQAVVARRRAASNPLDAVIEAWTEVLRWRDESLQLKRSVTFWLGLRPPASPKTIEGLERAVDDPDTDTRLYARHGLDRALKSMERAASSPTRSPQAR